MRLHISLDPVAVARQARPGNDPDPVRVAVLAELGGADAIAIHLGEDRAQARERDVELLLATLRTGLALRIAAGPELVELAAGWRPSWVTLVPGPGVDAAPGEAALVEAARERGATSAAMERLRQAGVRTALRVEPEPDAIRAAADLGADAVELDTRRYAEAQGAEQWEQLLRLRRAAALGVSLDLGTHAAGGLTYENVAPVAAISDLEQISIGHSVASRALLVGMERAVRTMARLVGRAGRGGAPLLA